MSRKIILVLCVIIFITIGTVSAENMDINGTLDNPNEDIAVSETATDNCLNDPDVGTFDELQSLISSSYNEMLDLSKDYKKTSSDSVSAEGVKIYSSSNLETIDGHGHTLDASGLGRIIRTDGNHAITLKNIKFINGNYSGNGGAVYADSQLIFENCTFINNSAINGGAIYSDNPYPTIRDSTLKDNVAKESGGGLFSNSGFIVENSTFIHNSAEYEPLEYSSFAKYGGGAIYGKFSVVEAYIMDSRFINNTANYLGGAVNVQPDSPSQDVTHITNCNFTNNSATSCGAVFLATRYSEIENSRFIGNTANETGGAVGVYYYCDTISESYFENNRAGRDGGAVFSFSYYGHANSIENSIFVRNHAGTYGGAVNAINTDVRNSKFIDNEAEDYAGAVTAYGSDVSDSTFTNNRAPDGSVLVMNDGSDINYATSREFNNNGLSEGEVKKDYTDRGIVSPNDDYPRNVIWSDLGYVGFCCEKFYSQPYSGVVDHSLNVLDNNINGNCVSEYLKILMYTYFNSYSDFFVHPFHDYIWEFTDYDYQNSDLEVIQNVISLYNSGFRVPNDNALKVLSDGSILRMDFLALDTADGEQDIFLFNWNIVRGELIKEVVDDVVYIGEKFDFNITVKNMGKGKLSNITVEDNDFSEELIYVGSKIVSGNWTYDSKEKVWRIDNIDPGDSVTLLLTFKVNIPGNFYNKAKIKTSGYDVENTSTPFTAYTPQLLTKKHTVNKTVFKGELAEFAISVQNTGDCPLTEICVEDIPDEGLIYNSYINGSHNWKYENGKFYLIGELQPDEVATFKVLFNTVKTGNFTNKVSGGSKETENHTWEDTVEVIESNETEKVNETNETKVIEDNIKNENHNKTHNNLTNEIENNTEKISSKQSIDSTRQTGNPLFVLLIGISVTGLTAFRRKK